MVTGVIFCFIIAEQHEPEPPPKYTLKTYIYIGSLSTYRLYIHIYVAVPLFTYMTCTFGGDTTAGPGQDEGLVPDRHGGCGRGGVRGEDRPFLPHIAAGRA